MSQELICKDFIVISSYIQYNNHLSTYQEFFCNIFFLLFIFFRLSYLVKRLHIEDYKTSNVNNNNIKFVTWM